MAIQVKTRILLTDASLLEHEDIKPQVEALTKAGHTVEVNETLKGYDFIAGPNCWLLRPEVVGLFTIAVKQARKVANADETRKAQQQAVKKATTRKPRASRKAHTGDIKAESTAGVEGPSTAHPDPHTSTDTAGE